MSDSLQPWCAKTGVWTATCQASLSITSSWSLLKLMSIASVMPSKHLMLCRPLLLLPLIFPSIRVFSNDSVLHIRWPNIGVSPSVLPMNIPLRPYIILSRLPCALQWVPVGYSFSVQQCVHADPKLPSYPWSPFFPPGKPLSLPISLLVVSHQLVSDTRSMRYGFKQTKNWTH